MSLQPGDVLASKYRLEEVIGRGGFATIYRAVDETLGRSVAVKLLDYSKEHGAARFVREAKILGELQDGHTMRLFDFGKSEDGTLFMVCELLGGQDLSDLLEQRDSLSPGEAEHVMRQILSSLREAHAAGLLHRDVKPDNIRVQRHNDDPLFATLMDFGVARQEIPGAAKLTATGVRIGTAAYMAPEQAIGAGVGPATDLFSLGLVIAQCLTGDLRVVRSEMMRKGGPAFPGAREPLVRALTGMLELDMADRPQSVDAVLAILDSPQVLPRDMTPRPPSGPVHPPGSRPASGPLQPPSGSGGYQRWSSGQMVIEEEPDRRWLPIAGAILSVVIIAVAFVYGIGGDDTPAPVREQRSSVGIVQTTKPDKTPTLPAAAPDLGTVDLAAADLAALPTSKGCGQMPKQTGWNKQVTSVGLDTHRWRRHLPADYDPNKPYPVLLAFHTDDGSADKLTENAGLKELADARGMIVIALNGARPIAWSKMYPDSAITVLRHNQDEVCIDPERVVVLGYGSGGFPAEELSCEPWVHAAIFVSHRSVNVRLPCPDAAKPILFFQPMKSKHLPIAGGWNCSRTREHLSLKNQETYLKGRNSCESERQEVGKHKGSRCYTWDCETPLTVCHVDGGHQFPGMKKRKIDLLGCDGPATDFPYIKYMSDFLESVL